MSKVSGSHWEKVINLIEQAKKDDSIGKVLADGPFSQKLAVLREVGISMEDLEQIYVDLETLVRNPADSEMNIPRRELGPWWQYWPPSWRS